MKNNSSENILRAELETDLIQVENTQDQNSIVEIERLR
jgi:hypothetical protein